MNDPLRIQPAGWFLLAIYPLIWLLDLSWWYLTPDVIIIAGILPLAWFLSGQAVSSVEFSDQRPRLTGLGVLLLAVGILLNLISLIAFAWSWLAVNYIFPVKNFSRTRLWILCTGAFPWILTEGQKIGWYFRLTGANLTVWLYHRLGYKVTGEGTLLEIEGLPISVETACGGLQLLQVLLSGGIAITLIRFPKEPDFWYMLVLLPMLAWFANTVRIIVIAAWGIRYGAEAAAGAFHTWGALIVVLSMLGAYVACAQLLDLFRKRRIR